jgi:hypothetical protein
MRSRVALPLALVLSLGASAAGAQPPPAPAGQAPTTAGGSPQSGAGAEATKAEAKAQFERGSEAMKSGKLADALALFRRSHELLPKPATLMNVALCEEKLGLLAAAHAHYQEVLARFPEDARRVARAKELLDALAPRLPRLRIALAPGAPSGTQIRRDDIVIDQARLGAEEIVDPGQHVVIVAAPGRIERRYDVKVLEGARSDILVEPGAPVPSVAPPPPVAPPPSVAPSVAPSSSASSRPAPTAPAPRRPEPPSRAPSSMEQSPEQSRPSAQTNTGRTVGFIVGGVGLAGLGVAGLMGGLALMKKNRVDEICGAGQYCSAEGVGIEETARDYALVSTVSLIADLTAVGAGVTLIIWNPGSASQSTALAPVVLPGGAGVGARGSF